MDQQPVHPLEYLAVVHRRKWWFIVPLAVCILGGALTMAFAVVGLRHPAIRQLD